MGLNGTIHSIQGDGAHVIVFEGSDIPGLCIAEEVFVGVERNEIHKLKIKVTPNLIKEGCRVRVTAGNIFDVDVRTNSVISVVRGSIGVVKEVNDDGDAQIDFQLDDHEKSVLVREEDFDKLAVADNEYRVIIKAVTGMRIDLLVTLQDTIRTLKERIAAQEDLKVGQLNLVWKGRMLSDENTCRYYKIGQESELMMTISRST